MRLTKREMAALIDAGRRVNERDLYSDGRNAIAWFYPHERFDLYDVGEVDIRHIGVAGSLRFPSTMESFWHNYEHSENLRALRAWPKVYEALQAHMADLGRPMRDARLIDVRTACYDADEPVDSWDVPETFECNACSEFGRMVGIMRWIDVYGAEALDERPIITMPGRGRLVLIDGWHRTAAARIRRWSSIRTIVVVERGA